MIKLRIRFYDNLINISWQNKEKFHRLDGPAFIYPKGVQEWYKDGFRHRGDDKPAVIYPDGSKCWFKEGLRHRDDGPAITYSDGNQEWWKEGEFIK